MSDTTIALIITVAIIALLFAWVPVLNLICPPCARFLKRRSVQRETFPSSQSRSSVQQIDITSH